MAAPSGAQGSGVSRHGRLTARREAELYEAVLDLLCENGYETFTIDALAAQASVSKATVYRHWPSKAELVAAALCHRPLVDLDDIDTGSLQSDLRAAAARLDDALLARNAALLRGVANAAGLDPVLRQALLVMFAKAPAVGLEGILRRAVARGEVPPDSPTLEFVPHTLIGAMLTHPLITGVPADQRFISDYLECVLSPALDGRASRASMPETAGVPLAAGTDTPHGAGVG